MEVEMRTQTTRSQRSWNENTMVQEKRSCIAIDGVYEQMDSCCSSAQFNCFSVKYKLLFIFVLKLSSKSVGLGLFLILFALWRFRVLFFLLVLKNYENKLTLIFTFLFTLGQVCKGKLHDVWLYFLIRQ